MTHHIYDSIFSKPAPTSIVRLADLPPETSTPVSTTAPHQVDSMFSSPSPRQDMRHNISCNQRGILDEEGFDLAAILATAQVSKLPSNEASSRHSENPFNLLPSELVSKVFFQIANGSRTPMEQYRTPGRLAPTCRRFRDIVYDSPELWTTLAIRRGFDTSHLPGYLTRSRGRPLHIDIHIPSASETQGEEIRELAAPVLAQAHRWESLSVRAFGKLYLYSLVGMVLASLPLPQLSRLYLSYASSGGRQWVECTVPRYPNVRVLEISDFYIDARNLHFTTLQELVLTATHGSRKYWKYLFVFLSSNPALQRLRLIFTVPYGGPVYFPFIQVELPSLLSLTIESCHHFPFAQLLGNFQAPQLSELFIRPEPPRVSRCKWETMDELLGTCLDRFGALNQIALNGLPSGASNAVRQDCRRRQMNLPETGLSGADVTVRIDDEIWTLKGRRS